MPGTTIQLPARQSRVKEYLDRLADRAPQVLLLEGGTADERETLALYWAARLNCRAEGRACLACPDCLQIFGRVHLDLIVHDGREGLIKIEDLRETKVKVGQPPRGRCRAVLFLEAQEMSPDAPNTLLKTLEEPKDGTVFVLAVPQRERILPTLVSRSWVLTLAWPRQSVSDEAATDWLRAFFFFLSSGRGWFERTGKKGAVDRSLASRVLLGLQHALAQAYAGSDSEFASALAAFPLEGLRRLDLILERAQEALDMQVNPALVLEWVATQARQA